jgi:hypothetical protein
MTPEKLRKGSQWASQSKSPRTSRTREEMEVKRTLKLEKIKKESEGGYNFKPVINDKSMRILNKHEG